MRANFVGRSVVSAITHTPASGCPLGARIRPPMSSLSMAGTAVAVCARAVLKCVVDNAAQPIAATLEDNVCRTFISDILSLGAKTLCAPTMHGCEAAVTKSSQIFILACGCQRGEAGFAAPG